MPDDGIIGVTIGEADLAAVRAELDGIVADVNKAVVVPALNKTAEQGATAVRRRVAAVIGLPQTRLKKLIKPIKANYEKPRAAVRLLNINTRLDQTSKPVAPASGSYPLKKIGPPVTLPNKGFKAKLPRGQKGIKPKNRVGLRGIFVRAGPRRLPIKRIYTPSPRYVFETTAGLAPAALADIESLLRKNLQSQVDRRLGGK